MQTLENTAPQGKPSGTWEPPGKGPHDSLELRVGYGLANLPATVKEETGVYFREFRISEVEDGWLAVVKGDRGKRPVVAYAFAASYREALTLAITLQDTGRAVYDHDRYPPKRWPGPTKRLDF